MVIFFPVVRLDETSLFLIFKLCPTHGFAYGCSCVMGYGLLHTLLPLGLFCFSLPIHSNGETFLAFPWE